MGCCSSINQDQIGIVEKCGEFSHTISPGCNLIGLPCVCHVRGKLSTRLMQLNVEVLTKTKDNVFLSMTIAVQFFVLPNRAYDAFYRLSEPLNQINAYVFDVVRSEVPKLNIDQVFLDKDEVAEAVQGELQKSMDSFGYFILKALVIDISPDAKVRAAMNEIEANKRLRLANQEKAEMDKFIMIKTSEAMSEGQYLQGVGISRQRAAIIDGLRDSIVGFTDESSIDNKTVLDMVMITQYFDTIRELSHNNSTNIVFFQYDDSPLAPVMDEIRNGILQANSARTH
eukprot:GHVR01009234.1.p1 GENE.GHVR01009234.1~~GHVR01009234.1.p1  ORF type:complete len:284 (+),score=59.48 GHVR01009234.1:652-1503(+)